MAVSKWLQMQELGFYNSRIFKPRRRGDKCVKMLRDYAEKLSSVINIDCCNDFSLLVPGDHVSKHLVYTIIEEYDISLTEHAGPYLGRWLDTEISALACNVLQRYRL